MKTILTGIVAALALEAVRQSLPMPIFPSYDFIDVLASEAIGVAA